MEDEGERLWRQLMEAHDQSIFCTIIDNFLFSIYWTLSTQTKLARYPLALFVFNYFALKHILLVCRLHA